VAPPPPEAEDFALIALTPSERRGALVVALLLALGALHDIMEAARPRPIPEVAAPPRSLGVDTTGPAPAPGATTDSLAALDLTRASAPELDRLPGIGPVLAARIVEYRRRHGGFRRVEELLGVSGIGPRLFERVRDRVRVGPAAPNGPRPAGESRNLQ
jgi:competence ComEA-like helix-hairpin-helix protein